MIPLRHTAMGLYILVCYASTSSVPFVTRKPQHYDPGHSLPFYEEVKKVLAYTLCIIYN